MESVQRELATIGDLGIACLRAKVTLRYESFQIGYDQTYDDFTAYLQNEDEIINKDKPSSLDSEDWVSVIFIENIELAFGIASNQSRSGSGARVIFFENRTKKKC